MGTRFPITKTISPSRGLTAIEVAQAETLQQSDHPFIAPEDLLESSVGHLVCSIASGVGMSAFTRKEQTGAIFDVSQYVPVCLYCGSQSPEPDTGILMLCRPHPVHGDRMYYLC